LIDGDGHDLGLSRDVVGYYQAAVKSVNRRETTLPLNGRNKKGISPAVRRYPFGALFAVKISAPNTGPL
jgi:hypothetical protein